jgi:DNA-binding NarL/FixJ family response regulator
LEELLKIMQIKTIFIAEDHQLVREAWKLTIEKETNFKIIGEADNCKAALDFCTENKVDVILMDINLKDGNSIATIKEMLDRIPNVNIVVVSILNVMALIKDLYKSGVKAYLTKNSTKEQLLNAINSAANGKVYFSPEISQLFLDFQNELIHTLSSKEIKVIELISNGLSNKEVADELKIAEKTIEGYKTKIYKKLNISNNIGLFEFAQKNGLI